VVKEAAGTNEREAHRLSIDAVEMDLDNFFHNLFIVKLNKSKSYDDDDRRKGLYLQCRITKLIVKIMKLPVLGDLQSTLW
jgi:hypothetical protein